MADLEISYASPADFTITLASLATSSTRVAGRESTAIDNSTNEYVDALVGGKITVGTTPTANTFIDVWVYAAWDEGPTYPSLVTSGISGTDGGATAVTEGVRNSAMRLAHTILVDATTSDRQYAVPMFSVADLFGGRMPRRWGLWVSHNTGVNLNSTGSNHDLSYTGIKYTSE